MLRVQYMVSSRSSAGEAAGSGRQQSGENWNRKEEGEWRTDWWVGSGTLRKLTPSTPTPQTLLSALLLPSPVATSTLRCIFHSDLGSKPRTVGRLVHLHVEFAFQMEACVQAVVSV